MAIGGANSMSPTSPVSSRHGGATKRKRSAGFGGLESSPGSLIDHDEDHADNEKKRQPGVKRACNECRQQKVGSILRFLLGLGARWPFKKNKMLIQVPGNSFAVTWSRTLSKVVRGVDASS